MKNTCFSTTHWHMYCMCIYTKGIRLKSGSCVGSFAVHDSISKGDHMQTIKGLTYICISKINNKSIIHHTKHIKPQQDFRISTCSDEVTCSEQFFVLIWKQQQNLLSHLKTNEERFQPLRLQNVYMLPAKTFLQSNIYAT